MMTVSELIDLLNEVPNKQAMVIVGTENDAYTEASLSYFQNSDDGHIGFVRVIGYDDTIEVK